MVLQKAMASQDQRDKDMTTCLKELVSQIPTSDLASPASSPTVLSISSKLQVPKWSDDDDSPQHILRNLSRS